MTIKKAVRSNVRPLVGFYGKSGSGKTLSALKFARGIAGPSGRITLIDTESGRGSIFADLIEGGYDVLDLDAPFSPGRYQEAIDAAEKESDCIVIDSMSHEWGGEGGVLDWAEEELERFGGGDNNKMRAWIKPKMAHKLLVGRILRVKLPLICCLRGEEKTHISKEGGKSKVVTDEFSSPIGDPRFIYEMLLNFEMVNGGYAIPRKVTHPDIARILPTENEKVDVRHGAALAQWCANSPAPTQVNTQKPVDQKKLKASLWKLTQPIHQGNKDELEKWLWDWDFMSKDDALENLTPDQLQSLYESVKQKLNTTA